ncbi:P-loop containing nucleoside triphosphate hydrolase protein, partial [Lactarius hatsudake]
EFNMTPHDPINWSEGVEHLHNTSTSELYAMLGFSDHKIPFLNSEIDCKPDLSQIVRESNDDPTPPAPPSEKEPLSLRWHQVVGVVKMMECALTSQPVLLMDDIGLGKTMQVLMFFCVLAYYRDYYRAEKTYPGLWGSKAWQDFTGKLGSLPELPFLFVVPPTLVNQVVTECVRFLQSGSFDIVPYTAGYKTHKSMWDVIEKRSHTALQSDLDFVFLPQGKKKTSFNLRSLNIDVNTIYGHRFLAVAVDEAHGFRTTNKLYAAVSALRQRTELFVAMTATHIQTCAEDLCNIGKAMGIARFRDGNNDELKEMSTQIRRARFADKKALKNNEASTRTRLRGVLRSAEGTEAGYAADANYLKVNAQWMEVIRKKYEGLVIRRTAKSLDDTQQPIAGLEPYEEHTCILELYDHIRKTYYEALESIAVKQLDDSSFTKRFSSEVRINFYINICRCLLHKVYANLADSSVMKNYEAYLKDPLCKLDMLVEIVQHHLELDGALGKIPSRQLPGSQPPSPSSPAPQNEHQNPQSHGPGMPDKIIIYSFFATSFPLIELVLNNNGIKTLSINGKNKQSEQVSTLKKFKESAHDGPRVLIISNVGTTGLNIAFANILIIVDVLWSVLSDQQLIGRVWCYPQIKTVHIYRLIADKSPDILLNNLSYSKGFIQESFANIGNSLRE